VANFLAHVDAENKKQTKPAKTAVSSARSAITVTYNAAFEVDLLAQAGGKHRLVVPGTIGNMQYYVVLNSQLTTKAPSNFPVHGPDYTVAYDFWIQKGPNAKLSLHWLVDKVIQLGRMKGFRGVDLRCLPAGSEAPVPQVSPVNYGTCKFLKIAFKDSKGKKGAAQRNNNGYTPTVQIAPLQQVHLALFLSASRSRLMAERCCFVRALGELRSRLVHIARVYYRDGIAPPQLRAPTGATPVLPFLLPFDHMAVESDAPTGSRRSDELQFLQKGTINERVRKLHEIQYGEGTCGRNKPFAASYYRHTSAHMYQVSGAIEARQSRLTQTEPDALFKNHYSKVPAHPGFVARLKLVPSEVLIQLSADELLHI
jgi:hypothetical protein